MASIKYQVFVSSTFTDLQDARREVIEALIRMGHIPIGMEHFEASDKTQWDYIRKRIKECDYYFVIVAERYGAIEPTSGKSYTQLEYEYAIDCGAPVAAFLLSDDARQKWPRDKVEFEQQSRLDAFRQLCKQKMVQHWDDPARLGGLAATTLTHLIEDSPMPGWIRGERAATHVRKTPSKPPRAPAAASDMNNREPRIDFRNPNKQWSRGDHEFAYYKSLVESDHEASQKISAHYLGTDEGRAEYNTITWHTHIESMKILTRRSESIEVLRAAALKHDQNIDVQRHYAHALSCLGEYSAAGDIYMKLAELSSSIKDRVNFYSQAASSFQAAKMPERVETAVATLRCLDCGNRSEEIALTQAMKELAENQNQTSLVIGLCERLLQLEPNNDQIRADLAYRYSGLEDKALDLYHLINILSDNRSGEEWNNLGVAYDRLDMNAKAVDSYKKAVAANQTLAMSNLAHKYLNSGFLTEAVNLCELGIKQKNYDRELVRAFARANDLPEEEERLEAAAIEEAERKADFLQRFGAAALACEITDELISSVWHGPLCELRILISDHRFHLRDHTLEVCGRLAIFLEESRPLNYTPQRCTARAYVYRAN